MMESNCRWTSSDSRGNSRRRGLGSRVKQQSEVYFACHTRFREHSEVHRDHSQPELAGLRRCIRRRSFRLLRYDAVADFFSNDLRHRLGPPNFSRERARLWIRMTNSRPGPPVGRTRWVTVPYLRWSAYSAANFSS